MKRIIAHWTAGTNQACNVDFESYHYLVTGDGLVIKGKYTPEDNLNCQDGKYAHHCGDGNTGSIGIALCGMYGYRNRKDIGNYPLTKIQCERFFKLIAQVAKEYNLPIDSETVLTHYEFGLKHPKTSSVGKVDITFLPPYPEIETNKIGCFIRAKARWYQNNL